MSKKNKIHRPAGKAATAPQTPAAKVQEAHPLIRFDLRTKIFVFGMLAAYFIVSSLKIHTSSVAAWDAYLGKKVSKSVLAGKPRQIRMDEWMVSVPTLIGQYELGLPVDNPTNGDGNSSVVFGHPIKDISAVLKPVSWPYFVFDIERAFAFAWNFRIFIGLISLFLLLMLLTQNSFWLSVVGASFILLSGGVQWWSYSISITMMYLNGMFVSFVYLLYSKTVWKYAFAAFLFICCAFTFISSLYPAFQVPLIYLYSCIFIGYLIRKKDFKSIRVNALAKLIIFAVALLALVAVYYHYYELGKETYAIMMNTVYPGHRFSSGGNLINGKFFAEFFGMFMTDTKLPRQWLNICEASGFIMFFPIVFYTVGLQYYKTRKLDPLVVSIAVFVIVGMIYVLVGFPDFLSKITLLSMTTAYRALPILGAGNVLLLLCFLGSKAPEKNKDAFSWVEFGLLAVAILIFIRLVASHINEATSNFFTAGQVNTVTFLITGSYLLIRYRNIRYTQPALYLILMSMVISNVLVNPITKGLSAITEAPLTKVSKAIHDKDPEARWALFGNVKLSGLLKANGINTINGVKPIPALKDMRVLDSLGQYDSAYNRYAWVTMGYYIDYKDTLFFRQAYNDGYNIYMDPCSPKLIRLGVKYFVFDEKPPDPVIRCMTKEAEIPGIFIYKRNEE